MVEKQKTNGDGVKLVEKQKTNGDVFKLVETTKKRTSLLVELLVERI